MQIKTVKLQELVSKSVKGVGNNKLIPLTSLMAIRVAMGKITLITTDATNYLYVTDEVDTQDFYAVVEVDTFVKLISRLTGEDTTLLVDGGSLIVTCDRGNYTIPLPLDEDGGTIRYPDPIEENKTYVNEKVGEFTLDVVKTILTALKPSLAVTMERPCYTGYYLGEDIIIATDTNQIGALAINAVSKPLLVSADMMNLLDVVNDNTIDIFVNNGKIVFRSEHIIVYGAPLNGVESYAVKPIKGLVAQEFSSMCKLPKAELLQVLDRISLFVDLYDEGVVTFQFTSDGLMVSNKRSSGTDVIPYLSTTQFKDALIALDINQIKAQVKAQSGDSIELWYGDERSIKMTDDKFTSILALLAN